MDELHRDRPRLRPELNVIIHDLDTVEIGDGIWNPTSFTLADDGGAGRLSAIVSLLDGTHTIAEVARASGAAKRQVRDVVDYLAELRLLQDGSTALQYYVDRMVPTLLPYGGAVEDHSSRPIVLGQGDIARDLAGLLRRAIPHVEVEDLSGDPAQSAAWRRGLAALDDEFAFEQFCEDFAPWKGRMVVWAADTVRPDLLRVVNRLCLNLEIPWLHVACDGPFLLIGPTFVPPRSACYECLERRVLMNMRSASTYEWYKAALADGRVREHSAPLNAVLVSMAAAHGAFEVLNFVTVGNTFTVGRMLAFYLPTMEIAFNHLLRLPGCPACGSAVERDDQELYFDVRALLSQGDSANGQ